MIPCRLHHLEFRCRQRGYTLDEVRPCIVSEDGDQIVVDETHPVYPREPKPKPPRPERPPLPEPHGPPPPPRQLPPLAERVGNFVKSAAQHVAAGMPRATDEQIAARFAICQGCEFLLDGACSRCGCPVVRESKFLSKLSWANEQCPEGKWGPVDSH